MNRLILLGNGFDLAHGMKTSYNDFIIWYLCNAMAIAQDKGEYADGLMTVTRTGNQLSNHYCKDISEYVNFFYEKGSLQPLIGTQMISYDGHTHYSIPYVVHLHSSFLSKILTNCSFRNWVDIENEYYTYLKEVLNLATEPARTQQLENLNESLNILIDNLEEYLKVQKVKDVEYGYHQIFKQAIKEDEVVHWNKVERRDIEKTLILNFNYTSTIEHYIDEAKNPGFTINYIHGRLGYKANRLIFGFGDELDENYKNLELDKTRGFFKHIKSFGYFKTRNYHDFLRYIESGQFQVFILGHSCGLSDRTMLNLIFEHQNCLSIKIFYYVTPDGNNNYTELTEEISRHFTSKVKMREKIVPFPLCSNMPQVD